MEIQPFKNITRSSPWLGNRACSARSMDFFLIAAEKEEGGSSRLVRSADEPGSASETLLQLFPISCGKGRPVHRGIAKYSNRRSRYKRLLKYLNEPVDRSLPVSGSPLLARFSIKC